MVALSLFLPKAYGQLGLPPIITVQPFNQTVQNGGSASFTVIATSLTALSYQWRFKGTNIAGATRSTYRIADARLGDAGDYQMRVSNASGTTPSDFATFTVLNPPLQ